MPDSQDRPKQEENALGVHITLLRFRELHRQLQVLEKHLDKLFNLAQAHRILDRDGSNLQSTEDQLQRQLTASTQLPSTSSRSLQQKTEALESAILRSNHQLQEEKRLLLEAQSRRNREGATDSVDEHPCARLYALNATRNVLEQWVEESLDCCNDQGETGPTMDHSVKDTASIPKEHRLDVSRQQELADEQIREQYSKYVDARKKAVQAVKALTSPLPPNFGSEQDNIVQMPDVQPQPTGGSASTLPLVETQLLSLLSTSTTQTCLEHYGRSQLDLEHSSTTDMLDRLRDESHLLQSYPILANSQRWQKIAANLGARSGETDQDGVLQRVQAWSFAADAADGTLSSTVGKHVESGMSSLDSMTQTLKRVEDLRKVIGEHSR